MMNDMDAAPGFAAKADHQRDRVVYRLARSRAKERRIRSRVAVRERRGGGIDRSRHLSMNQQDRAQPRDLGHCLKQVRLDNMWKLVNTRVDQKAFETAYAAAYQRGKLIRI